MWDFFSWLFKHFLTDLVALKAARSYLTTNAKSEFKTRFKQLKRLNFSKKKQKTEQTSY